MNNKKVRAFFALLFIPFLLSIFQVSGCTGQASDTGTTPSSISETLTISASPTTVAADGNEISVITATLTGAVLSGMDQRTVAFSTSLGTLSASEAVFGPTGIATVTLTSSTSGAATIYASIGGSLVSATVTFGLGSIAITGTSNVTDSSAAVAETTTITFTVTDLNGNLVSGLTLTLATPTTNHSDVTASFNTSSPNTNSSGVATAVLTTNSSDLGADLTVTFTASASAMGSATGQVIFLDETAGCCT